MLGPFNIDNVDDFCALDGASTLLERRAAGQRAVRPPRAAALPDAPIGTVQMWCGAEAALDVFLASASAARAMHTVQPPHKFDYTIEELDLRDQYRALAADPELTFVIYNGQSDANVAVGPRTGLSHVPSGQLPLARHPKGWRL